MIKKIINAFLFLILMNTSLASAQQAPTAEEYSLGPLLDLYNGGQAVGAAQPITIKNPDGTTTLVGGTLKSGTLLPPKGIGFLRYDNAASSWGSGLMISLLVNSSAKYAQDFVPGNLIYIGGISNQFGGPKAPHKSHQNGLDADILYLGTKSYSSVLNPDSTVSSRLDVQKNWNYWRMLVSERILQKGKPVSVVSMILVGPNIKTYLCSWAKANGLMQNPLDLEVLKRLRPTVSHDDHFHLRLKCSPHYAECVQQGDYFNGTGCEVPTS